jgi:hypothetical protein
MQVLVKLGLTSGCQDDRGTMDETTRWFVLVPCDVVARQCWCVLANSCSLGSLGACFTKKPKIHYVHETNGFIYFSYATLSANIICHATRQIQDLVKLGLTCGCQDDRGTLDETTRWFVWRPAFC